MTIYFYSQSEEPYGCFSNFSPHGVEIDGLWWPTAEHFFQGQKFAGTEYAESIRQARSARIAANLGRSRKMPIRPDWESVKDDIMRQAVLCKFATHKAIREILLSTGDREIVENSPVDYYWGSGQDGTGRNVLGQILVEVRAKLRAK